MPNYTSNYKLTKPTPNELYNIDIQNNNMDNVDTNLKKVSDVANEANSRSKTNESNLEALKTFQEDPFEETGKVVQVDLFQDAPLNVISHIEPIQSGSGDPYPAGGGKNLAEQIVYGYVTLEGNNAYVRIDNNSTSVIAGVVEGNEYTISCSATLDRFGVGKLEAANPTNGALLTGYRFYGNQSSAHELHFTAEFTGTAFIYLKSTKDETAKDSLQIEIGSTATEFAPYANIRPISGHTGAKLTRVGKNLLNLLSANSSENPGITTGKEANSVTYSGVINTSWAANRYVIYLPDGRYTLSAAMESDGGIPLLAVYIGETTNGTFAFVNQLNQSGSISFDVSGKNYVEIRPHFTRGTGTNGEKWTIRYYNIQLELGTAPSPFEPYQGETFSASFGQTVYGGTLDWNAGVLTVDMAEVVITGNENFDVVTGGKGRFVYWGINTTVEPWADGSSISPIRCSHFKTIAANTLYNSDANYSIAHKNGEIWFSDTNFSGVDDFKAYLAAQYAAGTPVQICYKLATPTTIQLTAHELSAFAGLNTLYSDCCDITVSGRKDIIWLTHSLIKRIEALEAQAAGL